MIEFNEFLGVCRILIGSFFLIKLIYSWDARELFWSVRRPHPFLFYGSFISLILSTCFFTLGILTPIFALLTWLTYVYLYRYVALFSLEDITFQFVLFYFVFAGSGAALSMDSWLQLPFPDGRLGDGFLPEVILIIAGGINFFSAGVEKLKSPMWRKGAACYYFFQLPNVRRIALPFLVNRKWIMWSFNHMTTAVEFLFLPALILNYRPIGFVFWFLALGFVLSLIIFFVLNWIGEVELIFLGISAWLIIFSPANNLIGELSGLNWAQLSKLEFIFVVLLGITLFSSFWTSLVPRNFFQLKPGKLMQQIDFLFRKISRLSWGIMPVTAFTEMHVNGVAVYQVRDGDNPQHPIAWPIFNEKFEPGRARNFRPTGFEAQSYKFTEACMELDLHGEIRSVERKNFFEKICELAWRKSENYLGYRPRRLIFRVCQFSPPPAFSGFSRWYLNDWVKDALQIHFSENGKIEKLEILHRPILRDKPERDLSRNSFSFRT